MPDGNDAGLLSVQPGDEIQQGDLFQIISSLEDRASEASSEWCLILTADCDIAQNKLDSCFTVLPVIAAEKWLADKWADEKCDQAYAKGIQDLILRLWTQDKQRNPDIGRLSKAEAERLVSESTKASIERAYGEATKFTEQVAALVVVLNNLKLGIPNGLQAWVNWRRHIGGSDKSISTDIRDAFSSMRGGYFFLPELPGRSSLGYVVLLRDIRAAPIEAVFRRSIDVRNTTEAPPYFLRIGRLSDNVRFAIAQQVATLFSRVGLAVGFEEECELAKESASEGVLSKLGLLNV